MGESPYCGGTSHILPRERSRATFNVQALTRILDGSDEKTQKRRWLWQEQDQFDNMSNYYCTREQLIERHVERFFALHQKYNGKYIPTPQEVLLMSAASNNGGAMGMHFGAFLPTLMQQSTDEQKAQWLFKAMNMQFIGCLAQTELGHGSNVRGLQTTATFDAAAGQFVLDTPSLRSLKWWPGGLGLTATHAAVYAQLILKGRSYGVHVFLLQLRDENHKVLPGIELGEIGPKIGHNMMETGFMRLTGVRIPRNWMLMKNQQVTAAGEYIKNEKAGNPKLMYGTMVTIRAGLVQGAGYQLARAVTIAVRYSLVRQQGFAEGATEELQIIDYQVQQHRLFKQLATAYAFLFTGKFMHDQYQRFQDGAAANDLSLLPEIHATSAGLKGLCTFVAAEGIEDCRKCCGGHGVMLVSGVGQLALDYVCVCTAEGDRIILELQTARFLIKSHKNAVEGNLSEVGGSCDYLRPLHGQPLYTDDRAAKLNRAHNFADLDHLLDLFEWRALKSVSSAAAELERGAGGESGWNSCSVDLVAAARAHCYFVIVRSFVLSVKECEGKEAAALRRLARLFCYVHLQENGGDWLGVLCSQDMIAIRALARAALAELRPDAAALVDAFEFPDNVLNSALGRADGNVYEALYGHAKHSPLSGTGVFAGYKYLRPHLDLDFLAANAKLVTTTNPPPNAQSMNTAKL